jgi:hypothetical protein
LVIYSFKILYKKEDKIMNIFSSILETGMFRAPMSRLISARCARPNRHRSNYVRTGLSLLALSFLLACTILAQDIRKAQFTPTTVVLGSDNPLIDVPAVQAAVDEGGTVILRGTFDFGTQAGNHIIVPGRTGAAQDEKGKSTVFIYQRDVTIVGETNEYGELLTVVRNGMPAFWMGWDGEALRTPPAGVDYGIENFPQDEQGRVNYRDTGPEPGYIMGQTRYARAYQNVSAAIQFIRFESPKHYGVKATAGRDIFVTGNSFNNVQFGGLVHGNFFGATHIAAAFGGVGLLYAPFIAPAFTGSVVAERNFIDAVGTETINTHGGECLGLGAIGTNAQVRFERNDIRNIGRQPDGMASGALAGGIEIIDNYAASPVVSRNLVVNSSGFGIWNFALFAPTPGAKIVHNTIIDADTGILENGFVGRRPGGLIHQNRISQSGTMVAGQSAIIASQLDASVIRANKFEGTYAGPLVVLSDSTNCELLENQDLRTTAAPESPTYFLDGLASDNLIRAASGTAVDLGTNNLIFLPRWVDKRIGAT